MRQTDPFDITIWAGFAGLLRVMRRVAAVLAASTLAACATSKLAPPAAISDTQVAPGTGESGVTGPNKSIQDLALAKFISAFNDSAGNVDDHTKAQKALQSGMALLDLRCASYLDAIGTANQSAGYERKETGLVGGLAAAVMGLTGSSAKEVSGVATLFSFAGSSLDTYSTSYLFSDAASSLSGLVKKARDAHLASVTVNLTTLTYEGAVGVLIDYEAVCRPAQIRALINTAIANGTVVAETRAAQVGDSEVNAVLVGLSKVFGRPFVESEAIYLYAWYMNPAKRGGLAANDPVKTLKTAISEDQMIRNLSQAFLPIYLGTSSVPARWDAGVRNLLSALPEPQVAASGVAPALPVAPTVSQPPPTPPSLAASAPKTLQELRQSSTVTLTVK